MFAREYSSAKNGFLMFLSSLAVGIVIFLACGYMAGIFSPGKDIIRLLTGSPLGWVALFGVTLIISSPIIGLSIWAFDRAMKSITGQQDNDRRNS